MSNEPEEPIEPALHAYAQQRRKAAGAPLELHPATRQLLQGEVARTLAKPTGEAPSRFQFLLTAWPRLAFGGAIFATLVFVMVLMQSGNHVGPGESLMTLAKHKAKPAAEMEFLKALDSAAPMSTASGLAQPPPKPMADEPAIQSREEMSRQDFFFKAKSETAKAKAVDKTEPPAQPQLRRVRAADQTRPAIVDEKTTQPPAPAEKGQLMKRAERNAKLGADKPAAMLAVTPSPTFQQATPAKKLANDSAKEAANVGNFDPANGDLRLSFAQEDSRARFRQNLNSPPVPNVLTTFQIERVGNAIRIIDADGSTYAGQIIPANPSVSLLDADDESVQLPDAAKKESRENSLKKNLAPRTTPALAGSAGKTQAAGFSFQAVGTNQTLNQSVEFFGTLVLDADELPIAKAKTAAPVPASGPQTNVVLNQAEFPRGRIQGQAVVGGKNRFEINAVPATK